MNQVHSITTLQPQQRVMPMPGPHHRDPCLWCGFRTHDQCHTGTSDSVILVCKHACKQDKRPTIPWHCGETLLILLVNNKAWRCGTSMRPDPSQRTHAASLSLAIHTASQCIILASTTLHCRHCRPVLLRIPYCLTPTNTHTTMGALDGTPALCR